VCCCCPGAFDHARGFAGVPAVVAAVRPDGTFAVTTRIRRSRAAGAYDITGRCGGGNLGVSATLVGLVAGTLAALGVWLLYRRRHPAGLGR
jgi:hypothetical protein